MAILTDATTDWSTPITLTTDEVWQTRAGSVYVTTTASPAADDGIWLQENHAVRFAAGVSVRYRKEGTTDATIAREAT